MRVGIIKSEKRNSLGLSNIKMVCARVRSNPRLTIDRLNRAEDYV